MRFPLFMLLSLFLTTMVSRALPQDGLVWIRDGGRTVAYEIACDELDCIPKDGGQSRAVDTTDSGSVPATVAHAGMLGAANGDELNLVLYPQGEEKGDANRRVLTRKVLVKMAEGADPAKIARKSQAMHFVEPLYAPGHVILEFKEIGQSLEKLGQLRGREDCVTADPLLGRRRFKRAVPNDPRYGWSASNGSYQWHLKNTGQNGGTAGVDVNIESVWDTRTGAGVRIGIVDDGLEVTHPDLQPNVDTTTDHNWNNGSADDPSPGSSDDHGTGCAGVAAARGSNGIGGSGAAPRAELVGLRLISGNPSDEDEAEATDWLSGSGDIIDIKSNSWGPNDSGTTMEDAGDLVKAALESSTSAGRGGLGTIHLWAAGNGGENADDVNQDGYANSIYTIAIGAVNDDGVRSGYSEPGAAKLVSAPSDDDFNHQSITTTDLLSNASYTDSFGGTSSATPLVAGICALMLEENPNLGWRDVQEILIRSARRVNPSHPSWSTNGAGIPFSHDYGAGLVDAQAAVTMAGSWTNLSAQVSAERSQENLSAAIPDNGALIRTFDFGGLSPIRVEHVTVTVDIAHAAPGDLRIVAISPDGTESVLASANLVLSDSYNDWTMMSVHHWGEESGGLWSVRISDEAAGNAGVLNRVRMKIYGTDGVSTTNPPVITSPASTAGVVGIPFSFQIPATNSPTSFSASGLPAGLNFDSVTGLISGVPSQSGIFGLMLSATNVGGTGTAEMNLEVSPPGGSAFNLALDEGSLFWSTLGAKDWFSQTATAFSGGDAARSGAIGHDETSTLQTQINGPGLLSFYWKVSSEPAYDHLQFRLDGEVRLQISDERDWTRRLVAIPSGTHTVSWVYARDNSDVGGEDAGYLDLVAYEPGGVMPAAVPLGVALDFPGLDWSSAGDGEWLGQSQFSQDGADAVESGWIRDEESTALQTNVVGPGTLSFHWKASTEDGFDIFEFLIDDSVNDEISGETPWMQKTVSVPAGIHTLKWRFSKDGEYASGANRVWVDQVLWVPQSASGFEVWQGRNFTSLQQSDPSVGQAASNPDGDRWNNLLEYAFGGDPFGVDAGGPVTTIVGNSFHFDYVVDTTKGDLSFQVETSEDLTTWTPMASSLVSTSGTLQSWRAVLPIGTEQKMMRLKVSQ